MLYLLLLGGYFYFLSSPYSRSNDGLATIPAALLVEELLEGLLLVGLPMYYIAVVYRQPMARFGLALPRLGRNLILGAVVGVGLVGAVWVYELAEAAIVGSGRTHTYIEAFSNSGSTGLRLAIAISVVAIAPIAEEIFYRGFVVSVLSLHHSKWTVVVGSSTLFALVHFDGPRFLLIWMLGAALALLFMSTKTLVAPILAHALVNAAAIGTAIWQAQ